MTVTPILPADALDRAAEAFRAEMVRQWPNSGAVGGADSYIDLPRVNDREAAKAVILAFLRCTAAQGVSEG